MLDFLDPLKVGLLILFFLPGFIFVQVLERHLLRARKPQLEKTLEILLASAFLWLVFTATPLSWPANDSKAAVLGAVSEALNTVEAATVKAPLNKEATFSRALRRAAPSFAWFYLAVCLWTFIYAHAWGAVRKWKYVDGALKWLTGRDWYPSVAFRFFTENLNKAVEVTVDGQRYMGILYSAPDTMEDAYVILTDVHVLEKRGRTQSFEKLELVDHLAIKFTDVLQIKAYSKSILSSTNGART